MTVASSTSAVRRAAALGAVSGLRTFTAPAVLALRGRFGAGRVARLLPALAVGELLGDKHPAIPPRSDPPSLVGRIISGAASGFAVAGPRGGGVGAAVAAAATYPSERLRSRLGERTGLPDPAYGLAEDAVAVAVAVWATRRT